MLKDFPSSRLILTYDAKGLNSLLKKHPNVNLYTETILIVDNDENTKQILERRLTKLGYRLFLRQQRNMRSKSFAKNSLI